MTMPSSEVTRCACEGPSRSAYGRVTQCEKPSVIGSLYCAGCITGPCQAARLTATWDPAYPDWAQIVVLARQAQARWKGFGSPLPVGALLSAIEDLDRRLRDTLEDAVSRNPLAEDEDRYLREDYDEADNL